MFTYRIKSGKLEDEKGGLVGFGYAGHGLGKNNPELCSTKMIGPLPCGDYTICPPEDRPGHTGVYSLRLDPWSTNQMFDRSAFYIHGDKIGATPGQSSNGCIILPYTARWAVGNSGDRHLKVVAE